MKTELQFLLDLLLNHKLPKGTKKLITDRIGEVENNIIPQPALRAPVVSSRMPPPDPLHTQFAPQVIPSAMPLPKAEIDKETGRAMVPTGNGTRGPRKF